MQFLTIYSRPLSSFPFDRQIIIIIIKKKTDNVQHNKNHSLKISQNYTYGGGGSHRQKTYLGVPQKLCNYARHEITNGLQVAGTTQ